MGVYINRPFRPGGGRVAQEVQRPAPPNILPMLTQAGSLVSSLGSANKDIQATKVKSKGIFTNPDFKYTYKVDEGGEPILGNVFKASDPTGPGWFKKAGKTIEYDPTVTGKDIPSYITGNTKYANILKDPSGNAITKWSPDVARDILNIKNPNDPNFVTNTMTPGKAGFMSKAMLPKAVRKGTVTAGSEAAQGISGPMGQIFKAIGSTGQGFGAAANTTLGTAAGQGGAGLQGLLGMGKGGAGLLAGMTPLGWSMMALGLLGGLVDW